MPKSQPTMTSALNSPVAKALWDGALSLDHILAYKKI
jgi:hypothetical protein